MFLRSLRKEKEEIAKVADVMNHKTIEFRKLLLLVNKEDEEEFSDDDPEVCHL